MLKIYSMFSPFIPGKALSIFFFDFSNVLFFPELWWLFFPSSSCNRYSLFVPSSSPLLRRRKPTAPATTLAKNPTTVNARRSPFYGVLQLHLMNLRITRKYVLLFWWSTISFIRVGFALCSQLERFSYWWAIYFWYVMKLIIYIKFLHIWVLSTNCWLLLF